MKTKLLAVMATLGMVASASAVKVNNNLSINGFIDGSYYSQEVGAGADTSNIGLDEVELNILVNAGNISGELHIDTEDTATVGWDTISDGDLSIEQVHFTYSFSNGAAVTAGRFGSQLGLEREDPAGLYTFSRAYQVIAGGTDVADRFNLGNIDSTGAQEGVRLSYSTGDIAGSLSLYNLVDGIEDNGAATNDLDYELALSYTGFDNLTVGAGFQTVRPAAANADTETYTINATYTLNKLLVGAEYINSEVNSVDLSAYSILGDYDVNDKLGLAVRYSNWETAASAEADKLTFAPNYAITDSLGAIFEYSAEESALGVETDSVAVELTYTF